MINKLLLAVLITLSASIILISLIAYLVPWYTQELPYKIHGKVFKPGEKVKVEVKRRALISLHGLVVLELIRIEKGVEYEVNKASFYIDIVRGKKTVVVYYELPTLKFCPALKSDTYIWRGHITYKPFGIIERRWHFKTEEFQIKVNG